MLRRGLWLLVLAALGVLIVASEFPLCPTAALFGLPCPGCGLTRATIALLSGDFAHAFSLHPLVFVVGPLYVAVIVWCAYRFLRGPGAGRASLNVSDRTLTYAAGLGAALLVAVWLSRFAGYFGGPVAVEPMRDWLERVTHRSSSQHPPATGQR